MAEYFSPHTEALFKNRKMALSDFSALGRGARSPGEDVVVCQRELFDEGQNALQEAVTPQEAKLTDSAVMDVVSTYLDTLDDLDTLMEEVGKCREDVKELATDLYANIGRQKLIGTVDGQLSIIRVSQFGIGVEPVKQFTRNNEQKGCHTKGT